MWPEDEAIRIIKTQIEGDRPRHRRDRRFTRRHDVRVAAHERVLGGGPRVIHIKPEAPVLVDAPRGDDAVLVVDLHAPFGNLRAAALADGGRRARCPRVLEGHGPEVRSLAAAVRVLRVSRRRRSAWAASRRTAATPSLRRGSAWLLWLASGCSMDGGRPTRSTGCFSPSMSGSAVGGEG